MTKLTHKCACPDHAFDRSWFDQTKDAINLAVHEKTRGAVTPNYTHIFTVGTSRADNSYRWENNVEAGIPHFWHISLVARFKLHPVVELMLAYRPADLQQLVLEWPHISETDSNQLAYTRDDTKGIADVQTTTSIGKYVARHWPLLPDHIRRDVCSLYTADECFFVEPCVKAFAIIVDTGPTSCMQGGWNGRGHWKIHPYTVYDPALGWGMAARRSNGQIDGRALTYTCPDSGNKTFVRAYSRNESGYSQGDVALASWLTSQGFTRANSFEGAVIARVETQYGGLVAPYIDGGAQNIEYNTDRTFTITVYDGDYQCNNTDGTADDVEEEDSEREDYRGACQDCGASVYEGDDYIYTGRHEEDLVCSSCEDNYTRATGANRHGGTHEYHVHNDNTVECNGEYYDSENLPSNIMQLEDGDWFDSEEDNYCIIDDEYYLCDDSRVVCCADEEWRMKDDGIKVDDEWYDAEDDENIVECSDGEQRLRDDCWQCEGSGEWYSDDEDKVELDDGDYHPSYLSELVTSRQVAPLFPAEVAKPPAPAPAPAWPFVPAQPELATA